jgi:hypothetical protein
MTPIPESRGELRQFGLVVGGVALAAGGWWRYRGLFPTVSALAMAIGACLLVCAALVPLWLGPFHRVWMAFGEGMSWMMTRVILFLVFVFVITPIGLARRAFGADPLRRRAPRSDSYWEPYSTRQSDRRHYENMF